MFIERNEIHTRPSFMEALKGWRSYLLAILVIIPFVVLAIYFGLTGDTIAYQTTLAYLQNVIITALGGVGISKGGTAIKTWADNRNTYPPYYGQGQSMPMGPLGEGE